VVWWGVGTEKISNYQSQWPVMLLYLVGYKLVPCITLFAGVNYRGLLQVTLPRFPYNNRDQPVTEQELFENLQKTDCSQSDF